MTSLEKRMVLMNALFNIVFTLFLSFVSVFLYAYTKSFVVMSLFVVCRVGVFPIMFRLANIITRKKPYAFCMGIGIVLIVFSLLFAITQTKLFIKNGYYSLVVALIAGIGFGLYWFGSNTLYQIIPTDDSRANFLSYYYTFNSAAALVAPFISDIIISLSANDIVGYRNVLIFIIVVGIVVLFFATKLNVKAQEKPYSLIECLKLKDPIYKNTMLGIFFYAMKDSLTLSITSILVSNAAGSGNLYSRLLIVFSAISIFLCRYLTKLCKPKNLKISLLLTSINSILSTLVLALWPNMFGAIFFGITNAISTALYQGEYNYLIGQSIQRYQDDISGRVTAKETYTTLGRSVAMFFVVACYFLLPENIYLKFSVSLISFTPIMVIYFFNKVIDELNQTRN